MMTRTLLARCAPLAIAATAAFPLIPTAAQDAPVADPVIVLPPVEAASSAPAPAPAPAPTIVLPAPEPVAAVPVERVEESVAATSAAPTQARAAGTPAATPVAAVPAAQRDAILAAAPDAGPPLAQPATVEADTLTADPVAATNDGTNEGLIAGLLAALGLTAVGTVALIARRRRRADQVDATNRFADRSDYTAEPARQPELDRTPAVANGFATAAPSLAEQSAAPRARNSSARAEGDPVALPNAVPATYEERDALLKELVAAEPDRANPFTSVRARARRAKLIMQSLGQDFRSRKPRIDLSEYSHRWPALRGWQPATA